MKQLSLIILTYNSEKDIYDCLESVKRYNDIGDALEIIVVDNNSTNYVDMHDKIKSLYPDVRIIANTKNGGYGQGNNIGIRAASAPIVSIMNPDVRLIMPVFQTFIDVLSKDDNIMCGAKQYATLQKQNASFYYDFTEFGFKQYFGRIIRHKLDLYSQKKMWLQGAFFTIKKNVFEQIGLFDENIFMYAEEFDIHIRLTRLFPKHNIMYLPQLKYLHLTEHRINSERNILQQYKANIYVCIKHGFSAKKMLRNMLFAHMLGHVIISLSNLIKCQNTKNKNVQKRILLDLINQYNY